jgi:Fis family transcriptional regulator, factor for inversion stimulation protein
MSSHSRICQRMQNVSRKTRTFLEKWLDITVKDYVKAMRKEKNGDLYDLIVGGVEKPLLDVVLKETNGNQTQAAAILGINRNTLRKKITEYQIQCPKKV